MVRSPRGNGAGTAVAEEQVEVRVEEPVETPVPAGTFERIPIERLRESATNPRKTFEKEALQELTESVRQRGVLQPILVRPTNFNAIGQRAPGEMFEIIAGARRYRASKAAGLDTVPAIVQDLDDRATLEVQVIENLQRADLHPMEEARGYRLLMQKHQFTAEQIAARVHKSKAYIYGRLRLCDLPAGAVKLFEAGELDASRALLVARIPVPELAEKAAREIAYGRWQAEHKRLDPSQTEPMGYREASEHVQREYMLRLKDAPFPTGDAQLVVSAGACGACPKRTGNQRDLFGDVQSADLCVDPKCFRSKVDAWFAKRSEAVEARGGEVLDGKKADQARHGRGLVNLSDPCAEDPKWRTYSAILGKAAEDLAPTLLRTSDGVVIEKYSSSEISKALKAKGVDFKKDSPGTSRSAKERQREAAHKRRLAAARLAAASLPDKTAAITEAPVLRFLIECLAGGFEGRDVLKAAKIDASYGGLTAPGRAKVAKLGLPELRAIAIRMLVGTRYSDSFSNRYSKGWLDACELVGIDMKAFEAQVPVAGKGKIKAAVAKLAKGPRPPKPTTKRKKARKGKAAAAGDDT